ncbi:hypothetical protein AB0G02_19970 [Actinosynnema sp. NPDC023658]|uniref:hypothetical protein n=1 Tax=Actinosynnema sp. NPDC023658 TaxID=3155465 RepID=UPI0033D760F8
MTATTTSAPVTARRVRVGWADLAWLTWRQHRWVVLGTAVAVVGTVALSLGMALHVDATGDTHELLGRFGYVGVAQQLALVPMVLGLVIALFWAAPLLSREYEQRTHLVVWSQDLTALRWLAGKVVLLGAVASALAAGLGLALVKLMNSLNAADTAYPRFQPFDSQPFEAAPQVQVGYALFGFALGVACSAITRRTVPAMGVTLVVFLVVRFLVARVWRPYFLVPLHRVGPYDEYAAYWSLHTGSDGSWVIDRGYADVAGNETPFPTGCESAPSRTDYARCLDEHGVRFISDYHPADRLVPFQWFEFAIFAVLAAALFALAFARVRRAHRV